MIYIKYIGKIKNKNGTPSSWGWFFCEFCETYCKRRLDAGKISKSCGCNKYNFTEEHNRKISEKAKERFKNPENHPMFGKCPTEEHKNKNSQSHIGLQAGENNPMYGKKGILSPNWQNGKSFEPYSPEFNKDLKQSILERDKYTCQCPDCGHRTDTLDCHHIDYDKKNNIPENLTTLCRSCHSKTNGKKKRPFWTEFYQNIMINRIMECLL